MAEGGLAGGTGDFEAFVREAAPGLLELAHALTGNPADAEDVAQEALARVGAAWPRLRAAGHVEAYARRTLVNVLLNERRRRHSERRLVARIAALPAPAGADPHLDLVEARRLSLRRWAFTSAGGGRLYVTQILPHPSAEHPGPRPAADPADVDAAARTIVAIESARGVGEDAAQAVAGLPLGPGTLVRFDDRNGILLASPAASPAQVLLLQVGGAPVDTLVALARSAHR